LKKLTRVFSAGKKTDHLVRSTKTRDKKTRVADDAQSEEMERGKEVIEKRRKWKKNGPPRLLLKKGRKKGLLTEHGKR